MTVKVNKKSNYHIPCRGPLQVASFAAANLDDAAGWKGPHPHHPPVHTPPGPHGGAPGPPPQHPGPPHSGPPPSHHHQQQLHHHPGHHPSSQGPGLQHPGPPHHHPGSPHHHPGSHQGSPHSGPQHPGGPPHPGSHPGGPHSGPPHSGGPPHHSQPPSMPGQIGHGPGVMPPHGGPGGMPPGPPGHHGMPPPPHTMPDGRPLDHGRHTPYFGQPDYRIYEMNKRLQQRTEESDNLWWDAFATEFFEDDATLTLTFCLEDGPKRYTIGRTLIPRYFRSIFEGGVQDLYFNLKHPKESFHNTTITLDCDQCTMVTHHGKPIYNKGLGQYPIDPTKEQFAKDNAVVVCTEGRLILEFTFDDLMRIKSWHFATRQHRELLPRGLISIHTQQQDPAMLEQMTKNITRQGLTNSTLNYLRLCVILEPMQELMSRHKAYALSPRDCLKTTLFQKWQRMVAPPETQRPPSKRRKRKSSTTNNTGNATGGATGGGKKKNMSPGPPNFSLASQDVMVVGEPSLMGGEFGDEDERLITRLENTQYDASAAAAANGLEDNGDEFGGNNQMGPGPNAAGGPPPPPPTNASWSGPPNAVGPPQIPPPSQAPPSQVPTERGNNSSSAPPQSNQANQDEKKPSPAINQ